MATFNIYGCCICRDLFSLVPNNTHEVIHFLQSSSQTVNFLFNTKPKKQLTFDDFENISMPNFEKKCIINDYNKTLVDYYTKMSDFFILDLINIANTNLMKEISEDGTEHYFTNSSWFSKAFKKGLNEYFKDSKLELLNRFDVLEEYGYDTILDNLIKWIKGLGYKEEQIILIEDNRTPYYTHKGKLYCFPEATRDKVNGIVADMYEAFKEKCKGCHAVKMPVVAYADSNHKWSLTDQHYCHEVYEYLYKCVDAIAEDLFSCDEKIAQLREQYSLLLYKKLNGFIRSSLVGKQYLNEDLSASGNRYIAVKDALYYKDSECKNPVGTLHESLNVLDFDLPYSRILKGYVKSDDCVRGLFGNGAYINDDWKVVNNSTCVILKDNSIVIQHAGNASKAQMNVIQTVKCAEELCDTTVTFSALTRVLHPSNVENLGGTIAFINSDSYNQGEFYKSKSFANADWQRISLTAKLPKKEDFNGLTVCLRANAGTGDEPQHAVVEFAKPKLEIGVISTDFD